MSMKVDLTNNVSFDNRGIPTPKSLRIGRTVDINLPVLGRLSLSGVQCKRLFYMGGDELWWMFFNQRVIR